MVDRASDTELPKFVREYFWDYNVAQLRPEADRAAIMLRIMESGDQDAIRWLRAQYGDEALSEFLDRRRGRGVSLKRLRYWGLLLDIPRASVTAWIETLRLNPWYSRVRR